MPKPLKLSARRWRSRWIYMDPTGLESKLHRVAEARWKNVADYGGSYVEATGTTVCGRTGELRMPGILSRMGRPRCAQCCKALGIPIGRGAPFNDKSLTVEHQNV